MRACGTSFPLSSMKTSRTRKIKASVASTSTSSAPADKEKHVKKRRKVASSAQNHTEQELLMDEMTTVSTNPRPSKRAKGTEEKRGVLYIGRIPHGFFESQMKEFLSQFGEVTQLRISRNKKTGKSRHYGWAEFKHRSVAEVVAKTMHNYLLFGHLLKMKLLSDEEIPHGLFKGAGRRFKRVPRAAVAAEWHNRERNEEEEERRVARLIKREKKLRKRLVDAGIDYDFSGYAAAAGEPNGIGADESESEVEVVPVKRKREIAPEGDADAHAMPKRTKKQQKQKKVVPHTHIHTAVSMPAVEVDSDSEGEGEGEELLGTVEDHADDSVSTSESEAEELPMIEEEEVIPKKRTKTKKSPVRKSPVRTRSRKVRS